MVELPANVAKHKFQAFLKNTNACKTGILDDLFVMWIPSSISTCHASISIRDGQWKKTLLK
jgi:hypothetical protein